MFYEAFHLNMSQGLWMIKFRISHPATLFLGIFLEATVISFLLYKGNVRIRLWNSYHISRKYEANHLTSYSNISFLKVPKPQLCETC